MAAMVLSARGDARRDSMATTIQQMPPVAHVPLVLGGLRRSAVATVMARLIPPDPAPGLAGVASKRWGAPCWLGTMPSRREEPAGRARHGSAAAARGSPGAALPEDRVGPSLDALLAANLNGVKAGGPRDLWRAKPSPRTVRGSWGCRWALHLYGHAALWAHTGLPWGEGSMRSGARQEFQHMAVGIPKVDASPPRRVLVARPLGTVAHSHT